MARNHGKYSAEAKLKIIKSALALHSEGVSWNQIANKLGVSRETLRKWVNTFRETAPVPLGNLENSRELSEQERADLKNLKRLNEIFLKILDKIERLLSSDEINKDTASSLKNITDTASSVMKNLLEISQVLDLRKATEKVGGDAERLRRIREQHLAQYQSKTKAG